MCLCVYVYMCIYVCKSGCFRDKDSVDSVGLLMSSSYRHLLLVKGYFD